MNINHLLQLQSFLSEMRAQVSQGAYFHYGDLVWRMNNLYNEFNEATDIKIWLNGNSLMGFVFNLAKENNPEIFIRPELYSSQYAKEMLDYAIESARARGQRYIETSCLISDKIKEEFLRSKGFHRQNDTMVFMENQNLATHTEISLPPDYQFIDLDECQNIDNALMWLTNRQLNVLQFISDTENCLSTLICHNNQEIVSGSLCWYDNTGECGLFEPVETNTEHQGKSLAYIGMNRSLRQLKSKGARKAFVKTGMDNNSAIHLYKKLGFKIIDEDHGWRLEI